MTTSSRFSTEPVKVKICGLKTAADVAAAVRGGASYIGFVFFPPSPRAIEPAAASKLAADIPPGICKVALLVDPTDETVDRILAAAPIDMIQLHGEETPARVSAIRARTGLPVMKAISVGDAHDLDAISRYTPVADQLLIDAKAPGNSSIPGGNGLTFDWRLIVGRRWPIPWMLAGGLTPENVAEAIERTAAPQIDASSSLESARGIKDPVRIRAFLDAAGAVAQ